MIPVKLDKDPLHVLCFGAHCDDIEIGCGGAILKLIQQKKVEKVHWIVFASNELRKKEAKASAELFLEGTPNKVIQVLDYRDAFLNFSALEIKEYFESIKKAFNPDIVFTHYREDRHQDHRLISDLTWNTFRNHLILEYEIPKYDGDLGRPNCFFLLNEEMVQKKIQILMNCYASQTGKHWFDEETFKSILRLRGMESAHSDRYAEAFYVRKWVM